MNSVRSDDRLFKIIPSSLREEPFEVFTSVLFLVSGIPQALGIVTGSSSLSRLLPPIALQAWGISLVVGSGLVLGGLFMVARAASLSLRLRGRSIERLGLILLGWVVLVYSSAILVLGGTKALVSFVICFAFVLACVIRALVIKEIRGLILDELERPVPGEA